MSGVRRTCLVRRGDYLQTRFGLLGRRVGVPGRVVEVDLTDRVCGRADEISRHAEPHLLGACLVGVDLTTDVQEDTVRPKLQCVHRSQYIQQPLSFPPVSLHRVSVCRVNSV